MQVKLASSFLFALYTRSFGDIGPKRVTEMLLSVIVMLVGAIALSGYFSSRLTGFYLVVDGARNELFRRLELIVRHLVRLSNTTRPFGKLIYQAFSVANTGKFECTGGPGIQST